MKRQSALRNDQERDVSDENPYGQTASEAAFLYIRNYEEHANEHDCLVAAVGPYIVRLGERGASKDSVDREPQYPFCRRHGVRKCICSLAELILYKQTFKNK